MFPDRKLNPRPFGLQVASAPTKCHLNVGRRLWGGGIWPETWRLRKSQPWKELGIMHIMQGNGNCKGTEAGASLKCSRNSEEASLAGEEWMRGQVARHEFRRGSRGQIIEFYLVGHGKEFGYFKDKLKSLMVSSDLPSEEMAMITAYPTKTVLGKAVSSQGHHPSYKKGGPSFGKLWKFKWP